MRNRHDPVDHFRTHHQRAGQSMVDTYSWPGFLLLATGIVGLIAGIAAAAYQRHDLLTTMAPLAFVTLVAGSAWIAVENRRPQRIELLWQPQDRPTITEAAPMLTR